MLKKFGSVWQPVGAHKVPTFSKEKPLGATKGKSRQGGLHSRRLPITKKKVQVLAEEEEEVTRRDTSIDGSDFLQ